MIYDDNLTIDRCCQNILFVLYIYLLLLLLFYQEVGSTLLGLYYLGLGLYSLSLGLYYLVRHKKE